MPSWMGVRWEGGGGCDIGEVSGSVGRMVVGGGMVLFLCSKYLAGCNAPFL